MTARIPWASAAAKATSVDSARSPHRRRPWSSRRRRRHETPRAPSAWPFALRRRVRAGRCIGRVVAMRSRPLPRPAFGSCGRCAWRSTRPGGRPSVEVHRAFLRRFGAPGLDAGDAPARVDIDEPVVLVEHAAVPQRREQCARRANGPAVGRTVMPARSYMAGAPAGLSERDEAWRSTRPSSRRPTAASSTLFRQAFHAGRRGSVALRSGDVAGVYAVGTLEQPAGRGVGRAATWAA